MSPKRFTMATIERCSMRLRSSRTQCETLNDWLYTARFEDHPPDLLHRCLINKETRPLAVYISKETRPLAVYISKETRPLAVYISKETRPLAVYISKETRPLAVYISKETRPLAVYISKETRPHRCLYQ